MERYEDLKDIGSGNFGVAKLVRDKFTGELYAVKYIERGQKIDEHVQREIMNHRSLKHPNIIRFKEVIIQPFWPYVSVIFLSTCRISSVRGQSKGRLFLFYFIIWFVP
ncbi:unnamed protein product [Ilex paraguariensis]|uniref:non-specific serine/threonine protein kinase n=1 Tax=Ilex paraguariensis TaxID=185542 RepID=A0ABC8UJ99_9AQUA